MRHATDDIEIDLTETQKAAEQIRGLLGKLRTERDLRPFEYTTHVRIAPGEISHSHPVLTLNTRVRTEEDLLSLYLHEQMHWYVTWYSHALTPGWRAIGSALRKRIPEVPVAFPRGAHTIGSSYLHLVVNWLEIESTSTLVGRAKAVAIAADNYVYSGIYEIVLAEWDWLSELYARHRLTPIKSASVMSKHELALAARMEEAAG